MLSAVVDAKNDIISTCGTIHDLNGRASSLLASAVALFGTGGSIIGDWPLRLASLGQWLQGGLDLQFAASWSTSSLNLWLSWLSFRKYRSAHT